MPQDMGASMWAITHTHTHAHTVAKGAVNRWTGVLTNVQAFCRSQVASRESVSQAKHVWACLGMYGSEVLVSDPVVGQMLELIRIQVTLI